MAGEGEQEQKDEQQPPCRSVVDYDSPRELRKALLTMKSSPTDEEVEAAAAMPIISNGSWGNNENKTKDESSSSNADAQQQPQPLDWVLQKYDPQVTQVQSMQEELDRLLVLKSYLILDSQRDEAFDILTRMASRFFHTPISAISLVDLGRQWFASAQGLGQGDAAVKQTPRNVAFCAHTIQLKENSQLLIVPDAQLDVRFQDNPLVVNNVVRFYAGAPLLSPEGYKLGSFCVIDSNPRPLGLSLVEQAQLQDLASMAVRQMVDRRSLLQRKRRRRPRRKRHDTVTAPSSVAGAGAGAAGAQQQNLQHDEDNDHYDDDEEDPEQLIAHAANDLMTPLSGVQLSLGLLKEDEQVKEKLNHHQLELLHTAASCSDFTIRICRSAINSLRQQQQQQHASNHHQHHHQHHHDPATVAVGDTAASSLQRRQQQHSSYCLDDSTSSSPCNLMTTVSTTSVSTAAAFQQQQQHQQQRQPTTVLLDLLDGLAMVMKPIPKLTPIILTLEQQSSNNINNSSSDYDYGDDKPPRVIQCDDLKLFRSALNLLSNALKRTLIGAVHLHIFPATTTTTAADGNSNINNKKWKRSTWNNGTRLMFECMDTGQLVPKEEWKHLFQTGGGGYHHHHNHFNGTAALDDDDGAGIIDQSLGLSSVATFIHSLHGDFGFRQEECSDNDKQPHSVFWFSVPLIVDRPNNDPYQKTTATSAAAAAAATTVADKNAVTSASVVTDSCQSSMQDDGQQHQQQQQPACADTTTTPTTADPTDTACRRKRSHSCASDLMGNAMEAIPERPERRLSGGSLLELAGSAAMQLERTLSDPGFHEHHNNGNQKSTTTSSSSTVPPSDLQVVVGDLLHATNAFQKNQGNSSSFPSLLYEKHEQKQALEAHVRVATAAVNPLLFSSSSLFTGQAAAATSAAAVPSLLVPQKSQSAADVIADAAMSAVRKLHAVGQPNQAWPATCTTTTMDNATATTATTSTAPIGRRKKRGLVIDDSLVVRKSLARALEKQGFQVQQAVNGLEGLNRLKETLFDLVLCDFLMPVMDGMDCVKQYRDWEQEHHSGFRQYIVGISAHATANDGNQGIKAGMDLFKEKPISVRILSELLETADFLQRSAEIDAKEGASSVPLEMSDDKATGKRPATTATLCANGFHHESVAAPPTKFLKLDHAVGSSSSPMSESKETAQACLIATKALTQESNQILTNLQKNGWETAVANDGQEALRLLQTRNWDAICMDDDLPILAGTPCMAKFRAWEAEHRVNRQRMALLICSSHDVKIPSPLDDDKTSIVLPPHGFDGVLGKPVQWNELNHLLQRRSTGRSFDIVIRK